MRSRQSDGAGFRLAGANSFLRHFNAVITTVPDQMGERVGDFFNQPLVKLCRFSLCHKVNLFPQLAGQIPQHARKTAKHNRHRDHPDRHHRLLQVARIAVQVGQAGQQLLVNRRIKSPAVLCQHGLRNHQLTHQINQLVNLADSNPYRCRLGRSVVDNRLDDIFGRFSDSTFYSRRSRTDGHQSVRLG
ncbi:hypothetical protein GALL_489480 [mine drainage metagenome]|uniref:Uncharacterized protein n=1 Tax=mine drainage metagenome TaxID=410659 RepID=A0A1J5PVX8_9ZZZZ